MTDEIPKLTRQQRLAKEGRCVDCGEFSYPYYKCYKHRITDNIRRVLRNFERLDLVEVTRDPSDKRLKMFKWKGKENARKFRKYTPEAIAKMSLPRLKGKPMTDDLIMKCITDVLDKHQMPLTEKEIMNGVKQMKTLGDVIVPDKESIMNEYKLIQQKKSKLSRSQRNAVEFRVNFLNKRGVIKDEELV